MHEESKLEEGIPTDNTHESGHPPTDATIDQAEHLAKLEEEAKFKAEEEAKYTCPEGKVELFEVILAIEKYYNEEKCLSTKIKAFEGDELNRQHYVSKAAAKHYLEIKGVELIFTEFKEILFELAFYIKGNPEDEKPKIRAMVKKFLDECIFNGESAESLKDKIPQRVWPVSYKNECKQLAE